MAPLGKAALADLLARMEQALGDARADLEVEMGGMVERAEARLWQGQVLVSWERDDWAGGCLLRPALIARLVTLGATVEAEGAEVHLRAKPAVVTALSPRHVQLATRLGQAPRLRLTLRFVGAEQEYVGGQEEYLVGAGPGRSGVLLRLRATLRPRAATTGQGA